MKVDQMKCAVCDGEMRPDVLANTYQCAACRFRASSFPVQINQLQTVNEAVRLGGLKPLRQANFKQILDECAPLLSATATILDVGCGHGWFIEAARQRGYQCDGVEPDSNIIPVAEKTGATIYAGYFPSALPSEARFDAIIFNDVFEHIPDIASLPEVIGGYLKPRGLLIINLPMSDGLIYRASTIAARLGIQGPLARMWQRGLPSPHVSYFSHDNLEPLICSKGFDLITKSDLVSLVTTGLWGRIRADGNVGPLEAAATYMSAIGLKTLTALFPSDVACFVFRLSERH